LPKQALLTERNQLSNTLCLLYTLACGLSGSIRAQASQATHLERAMRKKDAFEFWQRILNQQKVHLLYQDEQRQ